MKIKPGFALRTFADKWLAVSTDDTSDERHLLITLNKTGAFVWQVLQNDTTYDDVVSRLMQQYDIDEHTAKADLDRFLDITRKAGILE